MIFTGDTLLEGHIGCVDLPGGNKLILKESLIMISKLPKEFKVFPGLAFSLENFVPVLC